MKYALTAINIRVFDRLPGEWLPGVSARCPCRQSPALRPGRRRRHQRQYPLVRHWAPATPCAVDSSTMPGCTSWLRPALMLSGTKPVATGCVTARASARPSGRAETARAAAPCFARPSGSMAWAVAGKWVSWCGVVQCNVRWRGRSMLSCRIRRMSICCLALSARKSKKCRP